MRQELDVRGKGLGWGSRVGHPLPALPKEKEKVLRERKKAQTSA